MKPSLEAARQLSQAPLADRLIELSSLEPEAIAELLCLLDQAEQARLLDQMPDALLESIPLVPMLGAPAGLSGPALDVGTERQQLSERAAVRRMWRCWAGNHCPRKQALLLTLNPKNHSLELNCLRAEYQDGVEKSNQPPSPAQGHAKHFSQRLQVFTFLQETSDALKQLLTERQEDSKILQRLNDRLYADRRQLRAAVRASTDNAESVAQHAAMKQVRLVMKRRLLGAAGAAVHSWRQSVCDAAAGQQAGLANIRLILKGMVQGELGARVHIWSVAVWGSKGCDIEELRKSQFATLTRLADKANEAADEASSLAAARDSEIASMKKLADVMAQHAAMKQVKLVMKRKLQGSAGAAVHSWHEALQAAQAGALAQHAAMKQVKLVIKRRLLGAAGAAVHSWRQSVCDAAAGQQAGLANIRLILKGMVQGELGARVHIWSVAVWGSKQAGLDALRDTREERLMETYQSRFEEQQRRGDMMMRRLLASKQGWPISG